jgi:hypothetical protein
VNEDQKARKPKSSFPKVRARTKRRECEATPSTSSVTLRADQALHVVERKTGNLTGVVAYHVISREGRVSPRAVSRKGPAESDVSLLGEIDFRKRKRGR